MWEDVYEEIDGRIIKEVIDTLLSKMSARHEIIVRARYCEGMTLKEIADMCKVSTERIRQGESKALRILRSPKYNKEFRKLAIPWVDKIMDARETSIRDHEKQKVIDKLEWLKSRQEEDQKRIKEEIARRKLKIVEHDHEKPSMKVQRNERIVPDYPPHFVQLIDGPKPYLHVHPNYGIINRDLDPETYDRWLEYLMNVKKNNAHVGLLEEYKKRSFK